MANTYLPPIYRERGRNRNVLMFSQIDRINHMDWYPQVILRLVFTYEVISVNNEARNSMFLIVYKYGILCASHCLMRFCKLEMHQLHLFCLALLHIVKWGVSACALQTLWEVPGGLMNSLTACVHTSTIRLLGKFFWIFITNAWLSLSVLTSEDIEMPEPKAYYSHNVIVQPECS